MAIKSEATYTYKLIGIEIIFYSIGEVPTLWVGKMYRFNSFACQILGFVKIEFSEKKRRCIIANEVNQPSKYVIWGSVWRV